MNSKKTMGQKLAYFCLSIMLTICVLITSNGIFLPKQSNKAYAAENSLKWNSIIYNEKTLYENADVTTLSNDNDPKYYLTCDQNEDLGDFIKLFTPFVGQDIRTGKKKQSFNNKPAIYIFGNIVNCGRTISATEYAGGIAENTDIWLVDVKDHTKEEVIAASKEQSISDYIIVSDTMDKSSPYVKIYNYGRNLLGMYDMSLYGNDSFAGYHSWPLIMCVNQEGKITTVAAGQNSHKSVNFEKYLASMGINVISVESVEIEGENKYKIHPNETQSLSAKVLPINATNKALSWTSADPDVAVVDNNGNVTGKKIGETIIYCFSVSNCDVLSVCLISVEPEPIRITKIKLNKNEIKLNVNKTFKLNPSITPNNATDKSVNYKSSNTNVATVNQSNGLITAKKAGTATITCAATDGSGVKATCKITVVQPVTQIKLNKTSAKLNIGKTLVLTSTIKPNNASNKNVSWTSNNSKVATVSSKGVVTAKGAGTATITCTAKDGSNTNATCIITVTRPVTKITLNNTKGNLYVGMTQQLKASVTPSNATNKKVTWSSSNKSVATVSSSGLITAKKSGTVTITCKAADGSGVKATCKITVKEYSPTQKYVVRLYKECLGREADANGLDHWTNLIQSKQRTPEQVAESFFKSAEFQRKTLSDEQYIKILYKTFLGREADASGLAHWKDELARGCSRENIMHRFATSAEFKKIQASFGL